MNRVDNIQIVLCLSILVGDRVARELIVWAGQKLGSMAIGVIRQLDFETLAFDVVLVGSLFKVSPLLVQTMSEAIERVAPDARLVLLPAPPVIGGVLLGMEKAGIKYSSVVRKTLLNSINNRDFQKINISKSA